MAAAHPEKMVVNVHPGQVAETELAGKYFEEIGKKVEDSHIDDGEFVLHILERRC